MDYGLLARSYNTLGHSQYLRGILEDYVKPEILEGFSKHQLHKKINDTLYKNYHGEEILKYKLADFFRNKDYVSAFEVKALKSRADFLVINGYTKSFEIKSRIDTLSRLDKQVRDYSDVFEYNTVVVDIKHMGKVEKLIPNHYGIWYFEKNKRFINREAQISPFLNQVAQLTLFSKRELKQSFSVTSAGDILERYSSMQINLALKEMLKKRYTARWEFVRDNWSGILPIDVQFFFNTNISPELIYTT